MSRARILIITNGHLCRNPRVVKEAGTLGAAGYDVTILNVHSHPPSLPLDREIAAAAPFRVASVNMLPGKGAPAFTRRAVLFAARQAVQRWGLQTEHALGPASALLRRARGLPAALTIVHNEVAHGVGLQLQREGRLLAADIEDWHSEDLQPAERQSRPLRLLQSHERQLLQTAAYTTTTSEAMAAGLHERYGGHRPRVIANAFPLQPDPATMRTPVPGPPGFFWFSQSVGGGRGLEEFMRAWALTTQPSRLVLLGHASPDFCQALLSLAPPDRRGAVEFLDFVSPAALPSIAARHNIGLALEDGSIANRNLTISNKVLQYLNAGLAVVATHTAGQGEVLAHSPEAGVLVALAQPGETARQLDALLRDRAALAQRQRAARRLAEERYCWEREAPRLLALVAEALAA